MRTNSWFAAVYLLMSCASEPTTSPEASESELSFAGLGELSQLELPVPPRYMPTVRERAIPFEQWAAQPYHVTWPENPPSPPGDVMQMPANVRRGMETRVPLHEWTRTARVGESVQLHGADQGPLSVIAYAQTTAADGVLTTLPVRMQVSDTTTTSLTEALPEGMFLVWLVDESSHASYPARINGTDAWWIGPSRRQPGEEVSVYGRNLSHRGGTDQSWVYLRRAGLTDASWVAPDVIEVNPYRVSVSLPSDLSAGRYEVWVHNGHGGRYGFSGPLFLEVAPPSTNLISAGDTALPPTADATQFLQSLIDAADPGEIISLAAGCYDISRRLRIDKSLRFVGTPSVEGEDCSGTELVFHPPSDGSNYHLGMVHVTAFPVRFESIVFNAESVDPFSPIVGGDLKPVTSTMGGILHLDGKSPDLNYGPLGDPALWDPPESVMLPEGASVHNCRFQTPPMGGFASACDGDPPAHLADQCARFAATPWAGSSDAPISFWYPAVVVEAVRDVHVRESRFDSGPGLRFERKASQVFVDHNVFRGRWIEGVNAAGAIMVSGCQEVSVTDNTFVSESYDPSAPIGHNLHHGRAFVVSASETGTEKTYASGNVTHEVGCGYVNCGENILYEGPHQDHSRLTAPLAATGTTAQGTPFVDVIAWEGWTEFRALNFFISTDPAATDRCYGSPLGERCLGFPTIWVQRGAGRGQERSVFGLELLETLADGREHFRFYLDRPWAVPVDETSLVTIGEANRRNVAYANLLEGILNGARNTPNGTCSANVGVSVVGANFDSVVADNEMSNVCRGVSVHGYPFAYAPWHRWAWGSQCGGTDPEVCYVVETQAELGEGPAAYASMVPAWRSLVEHNRVTTSASGVSVEAWGHAKSFALIGDPDPGACTGWTVVRNNILGGRSRGAALRTVDLLIGNNREGLFGAGYDLVTHTLVEGNVFYRINLHPSLGTHGTDIFTGNEPDPDLGYPIWLAPDLTGTGLSVFDDSDVFLPSAPWLFSDTVFWD